MGRAITSSSPAVALYVSLHVINCLTIRDKTLRLTYRYYLKVHDKSTLRDTFREKTMKDITSKS